MEWDSYNLPLFNNHENYNVLARQIHFDYCMETGDFKNILPKIGPGITLTQLNILPQYYFDPNKIKGVTRYDLLRKECDYLFEIDIPSATDYGILVSSDKNYLQSLLDNKEINWKDLP